MDPVTAALNAFAAFNQFLVTPAGQKFATDFNQAVGDIFTKIGIHLGPASPTPPALPPKVL